jgi:hypothetical protein
MIGRSGTGGNQHGARRRPRRTVSKQRTCGTRHDRKTLGPRVICEGPNGSRSACLQSDTLPATDAGHQRERCSPPPRPSRPTPSAWPSFSNSSPASASRPATASSR